jgi:hypothetical protein
MTTQATFMQQDSSLKPEVRVGLYVLVGWLLVIGASLFILTEHTDRYFSWTIEPPLTAAFLGASYWSGCLLALFGARERDWTRARALIGPVLAVTILLLIATLIHIDRFHMDSVTGIVWLSVYAGMPPVMVFLTIRQVRAAGPDPPRVAPFPGWFKRLLQLQVVGALALGLALFLAPEDSAGLWPWTLTPLTARAVGAWALGGAVFLALVAREDDWTRVKTAMLSFAVFGALQLIAVARYSDTFDWSRAGPWLYVAFLLGAIGIGGVGWRMADRSQAGAHPVSGRQPPRPRGPTAGAAP